MKKRNLQMKWTKRIVLIALLLGVAGMMKGHTNSLITPNETYTITCNLPTNGIGSITANVTSANAGDIVTITAAPSANFGFISVENWFVTDANNNNIEVIPGDNTTTASFIMPSSNVTVTASLFRSFLFFAIFEDYQACERLLPKREHNTGTFYEDDVEQLQLPSYEGLWNTNWYYNGNVYRNDGFIFLAKNEKEGFQLFFRELEKERNLRIEVSPFIHQQNHIDVLQHSVYWEEFFYGMEAYNEINDSLAEALIPYAGETHKTSVGHNKVLFIELESTKNQTPGYYVSTITAYDGNTALATRTIYAKVWNFALPEDHYSEVIMGLYNRNSSYEGTSSLFKLNGIDVDAQGNIAESDLPFAKQILDGYHECLLEHGVSTYEIPRWKMADDPKAAELIMADPRRKVFSVPVYWFDLNGSSFKPEAQAVITQYKDMVYDNDFLKNKAFFYPKDEPHNANDFVVIDQFCSAISDYWPGCHVSVQFNGDYSQTTAMLEGKTDILCPNQSLFDPYVNEETKYDPALYAPKQANFEDFIDRTNHPDRFRTWRYQGNGKSGGTYFWISKLATAGMMRRIVFWQQFRMNSDGWLHWNCAYLPDNWTKKMIPNSFGAGTGNGDGVLLYPGTMFGQSAETPIVSLRLKQLAAGIDDYDYLRLGSEFLTENDIITAINRTYLNNHILHCYLFNKQYDYYKPYTCIHLQKARYNLGEALSSANTNHTWGEWQTAVLPDENHDGLEIRACSHCGTQESRPKTYSSLYRFEGTEDNQWANLNNWANSPETLPAPGEAVVIAHDCEINDNTTQFYVIVNDGVNLTINEGATLTSQRITTEGNAQVIVEDGAQLKTMSEGVQATVKKSIAPHTGTGGWHFISSSLATDVVPCSSNGIIASTLRDYDLYFYDEPAHFWRNYKESNNSLYSGFNIEPKKGYLYANASQVTLSFAGTLQSGSSVTSNSLSYQANELKGWNLIGNPYPCNVYADRSYYTLNEYGTAIEPTTVSSATAIPVCTGIMVKAESEGESVTFSKTAPETQGQNNGSLQIAVAQTNTRVSSIQDKAIVSFNAGDALEKFIFNEDNAKLYIPQGAKDFAIACAEKQGEMPLNFKATKNGEYSLTINPEAVELDYLHLIDNMTGNDIDLLASPSYSFNAQTTDYESRFKLVFSTNNEDGPSTGSGTFAFYSNGNIIINGEGTVQVIDMTGRIIVSVDEGTRCISTAGMTPGVYVLRLIDGDNVKTQKIVIL